MLKESFTIFFFNLPIDLGLKKEVLTLIAVPFSRTFKFGGCQNEDPILRYELDQYFHFDSPKC